MKWRLIIAGFFAITCFISATYMALTPSQNWIKTLDEATIILGSFTLFAAYFGAALAFLNADKVKAYFTGRNSPATFAVEASLHAKNWDCILFSMGNLDVVKRILNDQNVSLSYFGLMVTHESETAFYDEILKTARSNAITMSGIRRLNGIGNITEARVAMTELISEARRQGCRDIAVEITGGSKPMSIGSYLAASDCDVSTLYTASQYNRVSERIEGGEKLVQL